MPQNNTIHILDCNVPQYDVSAYTQFRTYVSDDYVTEDYVE